MIVRLCSKTKQTQYHSGAKLIVGLNHVPFGCWDLLQFTHLSSSLYGGKLLTCVIMVRLKSLPRLSFPHSVILKESASVMQVCLLAHLCTLAVNHAI